MSMSNPLKDLSARIMGYVLLAGLAVLLLYGGYRIVSGYFVNKTELRVKKGQGQAGIDAGAEAGNTISNVVAADAEADKVGKEGLDAIRNAPEGKRGDVALAQSCRLRLNRDKQRCAGLRAADPGNPASAGRGN